MRRRLLAAVLDGVALPATLNDRHRFTRLSGTDLERIRGDVVRVGADFHNVIRREHGNLKTVSLSRSGAAAKPSR